MRLSPSYYPEKISFTCLSCDYDNIEIAVNSIEGDDVRVECLICGEPTYIQVIL